MGELSVDMTYATALFEAAGDAGIQEQVRGEMESLLDVFRKEPDFYRFFCMPGIPADEKKEVLTNVLGDKISRELINFLFIL
ncbi:MAG: F0F1 ATP synthase subunit delta, partial [Clostridiales bacterium]|nr:F0F1 ATP synthase subunit delta [Clostridiales bacterium]